MSGIPRTQFLSLFFLLMDGPAVHQPAIPSILPCPFLSLSLYLNQSSPTTWRAIGKLPHIGVPTIAGFTMPLESSFPPLIPEPAHPA